MKKFKEFVKFASQGLTEYDFCILLISYVLLAVSRDLNLDTLYRVSGGIFLLVIMWYFCTFVCMVVLTIIEKVQKKKTNIEVLIDEESKKGDTK